MHIYTDSVERIVVAPALGKLFVGGERIRHMVLAPPLGKLLLGLQLGQNHM